MGLPATMLFEERKRNEARHGRIEQAIGDALGLDRTELTPEARIYEDLGIDSIDLCELIDDMESTLGVPIPERAFGEAETVDELVEVIRAALDAGDGKKAFVASG